MPKNIKTKQGFTIIEVVLVLAVAGLIFLMVFIALPSLQRTQRDTQRRQDMSRVSAALVQYQTNNSKKADNLPSNSDFLPGTNKDFQDGTDTSCTGAACKFVRNYLNAAGAQENLFLDPDGVAYQVSITNNFADTNDVSHTPNNTGTSLTCNTTTNECAIAPYEFTDHIMFIIPGATCGDDENVIKSQRRHFAILMKLEGSGFACLSNQ